MAKQSDSKGKPGPKAGIERVENILAYMAAGLIGTSVLAMIAVFIISAIPSSSPKVGELKLPAILVFYPQFGLAAGAAAIIALVVVSARRRAKQNRAN
jgi:FtsH-binding integral membrane protein